MKNKEEKILTKFKVSIDRSACISDAICTAISENWYMDRDGKASFRNEIIDEGQYAENHEAEISCPVSVIRITRIP